MTRRMSIYWGVYQRWLLSVLLFLDHVRYKERPKGISLQKYSISAWSNLIPMKSY